MDEPLRNAVQGLLHAFESSSVFPAVTGAEPAVSALPADRIGRQRIVRELGRGGMGTASGAEQDQRPRKVA